jgi:hypothetical protein
MRRSPLPYIKLGDHAKRGEEVFEKGGDVATTKDGREVHRTMGSLEAVEVRHR